LRRVASELSQALEVERGRLGRELHDELGQELTGIRLRLGAMHGNARGEPERSMSPTEFHAVFGSMERINDGLRRVLSSLQPQALEHGGLSKGLRALVADAANRSDAQVLLRGVEEISSVLDSRPPDVRLAVFRVVQEALENVVRHAHARRVVVVVRVEGNALEISITDDGVGLPSSIPEHRFGVAGMRARALGVGGTLRLEAASKEKGTRVSATIPLEKTEP
jgi:signal transduction histidine kinase